MNKTQIKAAALDLIREEIWEFPDEDILRFKGFVDGVVTLADKLCSAVEEMNV